MRKVRVAELELFWEFLQSNLYTTISEDCESGDDSAKYGSLKDAYDKLYEESLRLNKVNGKLSAKVKNKERECTKIAQKLSEAQANLIQIKYDNDTCFEQL